MSYLSSYEGYEDVDDQYEVSLVVGSKISHTQGYSDFKGWSNKELEDFYNDKNNKGTSLWNKAKTELKIRGIRNVQKRKSDFWEGAAGAGMVLGGIVLITVIVIDDTTIVGVADDPLIVPAAGIIVEGVGKLAYVF